MLIDARASQSKQRPGLTQALVKEPRPGAAEIIIPTRLGADPDPRYSEPLLNHVTQEVSLPGVAPIAAAERSDLPNV